MGHLFKKKKKLGESRRHESKVHVIYSRTQYTVKQQQLYTNHLHNLYKYFFPANLQFKFKIT